MTPKEKAKELLDLFTFNCTECDNSKISELIAVNQNKISAFIAANEILNAVNNKDEIYLMRHSVNYWTQVKQEIEQL